METEVLTTFLGWATAINVTIFIISTLIVIAFRNVVSSIHAKMFSMNKEDIFKAYFQYLGHFKILIILFNLTPYIVLKFLL
jgi:hypothetical protein